MARLQKKRRNHIEQSKPAEADGPNVGPSSAPAVIMPTAYDAQSLHIATNHERHRSDHEIQKLSEECDQLDAARPEVNDQRSFTSKSARGQRSMPPVPQPTASAPRDGRARSDRPAPEDAGPSEPRFAAQPRKCGPACQKCGRPRKTSSPNAVKYETKNIPLLGGSYSSEGAAVPANGPQAVSEIPLTRQPEETTSKLVPDRAARSKRKRKYFSLPGTAKKSSFKGPLEFASAKGKEVEAVRYLESPTKIQPFTEFRERTRPASTPAPALRSTSLNDPVEMKSATVQGKLVSHVHFATDGGLGRFAPNIEPKKPQLPTRSIEPSKRENLQLGQAKRHANGPPVAAERLPRRLLREQFVDGANPPNSYEWPLVTTLINLPLQASHQDPIPVQSTQAKRGTKEATGTNTNVVHPTRKSPPKTSSQDRSRLHSNNSDHAPAINGDDISVITPGASDHAGNGAGSAGGRPRLARLRSEPLARVWEDQQDEYSPSDYGSVDDHTSKLPVTPPSDLARNETSVWLDDLKPFSSSIIASLLPGLPAQAGRKKKVDAADLPAPRAVGNMCELSEFGEEKEDEDWSSWGALPGSYGGAGMWLGDTAEPSPDPVELGAEHARVQSESAAVA